MSVVDTSSVDCVHQRLSKRKLDDYDHDFDDELVSVRMRKDEISTFHYSSSDAVSNRFESSINSPVLHSSLSLPPCFLSSSSSSASFGQLSCFVARLQFFVRMISEGNTLVIQGNPGDTVKSIHERIQAITGIPVIEQRLIYRGKQLHWEQSLADCGIQNDAGLQLVGRMRSTGHPLAWQVIDDMISVICRLCKNESTVSCAKSVKPQLNEFLKMISRNDSEAASGFLQIFSSSSAPAALVMLYMSPLPGNKDAADDSIRFFLNTSRYTLPKSTHTKFVPVVLEFCKLLHRNAREDSLYFTCRNILGSFIESIGSTRGTDRTKPLVWLQQIFPFVNELASGLSKDLVEAVESPVVAGPLHADVQDFSAFVLPLRTTVMEQVAFCGPIAMPLRKGADNYIFCVEEANFLYIIYIDLVQKMDARLFKIEGFCKPKGTGENDVSGLGWYRHLALLRELSSISKLYAGCEQHFWTMLRNRKVSFCALILNCTKQNEDNQWLHEYNDVIDFESRRHLVMMMFPKVKDEYEELHEMLIDRSQILAESFEYIAHADPQSLHGGLFMEFKNEQATGPGVLREWFFLVCQAIFNQKNALFVACPNDRRRFYPNPASKVDPLHLQYFTFAGRVIALALMHKVQVGIVFDRVFFLQLGGRHVTLEDICDADPCLYNSCKQILVMDAEFLDSDGLGLTFVREVEEMGSRKVVELCRGGKSVIVNSKNREEYVHLLIQHQFVTSIEEQVSHFAQGFADILSNSISQSSFFHCLHIGDLDWMLHGSELGIFIEEWKAHTEYNGYKETDPQISWLWKIVGEMSVEQRKTLLFFWTSVKYLPIEGFKGLGSLLYIYKTAEPEDRLPSSHTCFNRLCLPSYSCVSTMQSRLNIITQKHLGCSFGNW